eukprot:TRINITY_DN3741_c0_g1_i2.p1 TRINITY_DN3741_c0_g1~~TRINITY_DN3741_c0_g1_i2.p1  ORF type:complete len:561 (+),score=74.89 TRINITY_DN3741_c0_g1_i2:448-2130(+)
MYSGLLPDHVNAVVQILRVADMLSMPKLMRRCSAVFERELDRLNQPFLGALSDSELTTTLNAARIVCMFGFKNGDAIQRRIAHLVSKFLIKYFAQLYLRDLSWLHMPDFLAVIRDQPKNQMNAAIKGYLTGRRSSLSVLELDALAASVPMVDPQLALFCVEIALEKDSQPLYSKCLDCLSAEFVWLSPEQVLRLPFNAMIDLLKQDALGVLNEDYVFSFVEKLVEHPLAAEWNQKQKRKVWSSCRLALCSPDVIPKALALGASLERVKEALASPRKVDSADNTPRRSLRSRAYRSEIDCKFDGNPFGETGVLYWLGTKGHREEYTNPVQLGVLSIKCEAGFFDASDGRTLVSRKKKTFYTNPGDQPSIVFELRGGWELSPSHYALCHGEKSNTHALTSWRLEASNDGATWTTLTNHKRDTKLHFSFAEAVWPIMADSLSVSSSSSSSASSPRNSTDFRFWRMFRIIQVDPNSSGQFEINLCGVEFFGRLRLAKAEEVRHHSRHDDSMSASSGPATDAPNAVDVIMSAPIELQRKVRITPRGSQTAVEEVVLTPKDQKGWF